MSKKNILRVRVYYEDTDCGGVVYYANYLRYMERGRTEYLRDRCIDLSEWHDRSIYFAVVETNVKYNRSAHYGDELIVETTLSKLSMASFVFDTKISLEDGIILSTSSTRLACVDGGQKPLRIPGDIVEKLVTIQEE